MIENYSLLTAVGIAAVSYLILNLIPALKNIRGDSKQVINAGICFVLAAVGWWFFVPIHDPTTIYQAFITFILAATLETAGYEAVKTATR